MIRKGVTALSILIFLSALFVITMYAQQVVAQIAVNCGDTLTSGMAVRLNSDLRCDGTALLVRGDNVAIDGAGYSIIGNGSGTGLDIQNSSDINVKNLILSNFSLGMHIFGSRNVQSSNNEWKYIPVRRTAIFIRQSIYNGIEFNIFNGNENTTAIEMRDSGNSLIAGNEIKGVPQGIILDNSSNITVKNNLLVNTSTAFNVRKSENITLNGNRMINIPVVNFFNPKNYISIVINISFKIDVSNN